MPQAKPAGFRSELQASQALRNHWTKPYFSGHLKVLRTCSAAEMFGQGLGERRQGPLIIVQGCFYRKRYSIDSAG